MEDDIMPDDTNDGVLGEQSNYSKKAGFDKGGIVQGQVEKCLVARAKDLTRPGYITWFLDRRGEAKPKEIPDFRKEFIGAVRGLKSLMSPEILKDADATKALKEYEEGIKEAFEEYAYNERITKVKDPKNPFGRATWVYTGKKYMPELGAVLPIDDPDQPYSVYVKQSPHHWDKSHNAYYSELVTLSEELLDHLNILIDKNNYFKAGSSW